MKPQRRIYGKKYINMKNIQYNAALVRLGDMHEA